MKNKQEILTKMLELQERNQTYVMATVVETEGSVPGKIGFKILVENKDLFFGTVGGGAIEKRVIDESLKRMKTGKSGLQEYILQDKRVADDTLQNNHVVPMMCNGKVWIYYEVNQILPEIYLFGGGHVGRALSEFLTKLNFKMVLIDNRNDFTSKEANPWVHQRVFSDYESYALQFSPPSDSAVVIMTQGHHHDYEVVKAIYQRNIKLKYIGVIASRSKAEQIIKKLKEEMGKDLDLSNLYTPIGLNIGGNSENEIGLSIAAQIQAVYSNKDAKHLRLSSLLK